MRTTEGGPPITEDDVANFERRCGIALPPSYREFLLSTNGGRPERDLFSVPGFSPNPVARIHFFKSVNDPIDSRNLEWLREVMSDRIPEHLLVIATTEGADMICMSLMPNTPGAVYYWDGYQTSPTYGTLYIVANGFEEFLEGLYRDDLSPNDDDHDVN